MNRTELMRDYQKFMQEKIDLRMQWWKESREAWANCMAIAKIPELPEEPAEIAYGENEITLRFRYDKFLIRAVTEAFENADLRAWWKREEKDITDSYSNPQYEYTIDNFEINVIFSDSLPGSTCKRKKIGVEKRDVPIYEWACDEAEELVVENA